MTRLAAGARDRSIEVDHLSVEITLGAVTHLPGLDVEILHFDVQLVERTASAEREPSLGFWVSFLRAVRQHPILAVLAVASKPE